MAIVYAHISHTHTIFLFSPIYGSVRKFRLGSKTLVFLGFLTVPVYECMYELLYLTCVIS